MDQQLGTSHVRAAEGQQRDMGEQPYTVVVDGARGLVRATLRGIWSLEILGRYSAALVDALGQLARDGHSPASARLLIDLRQHGIQPREVAEAIQARVSETEMPVGRTAVLVSPSALHRMQAQRIGALFHANVFDDDARALSWLLGPA